MNDNRVRRQIFDALNSALAVPGDPAPEPPPVSAPPLAPNERVTRLSELMTAIRTEVHESHQSDAWLQVLEQVLTDKQVRSLTYGPESTLAPAIETAWRAAEDSSLPVLEPYDQAIEDFKERLFQIDAGITTTLGAVADVGAVIIWPDATEPRLLSLVPAHPHRLARSQCHRRQPHRGHGPTQMAPGHAHQRPADLGPFQNRRYRV